MRPNDYYGHYKSFIKELSNNPELTLQEYCNHQEVVWRRLYDWMRRNKISLKRLYASYRDCKSRSIPVGKEDRTEFREIILRREDLPESCLHHPDPSVVAMSRILLPTGTVIELKDCPLSALSVLLSQCMGREVGYVQS